MKDSPRTSPKSALRQAKGIFKARGHYKVLAEEKPTSSKKTDRNDLPEHIRNTIHKQQQAQTERESAGRALPKAKYFPGGKVSPK